MEVQDEICVEKKQKSKKQNKTIFNISTFFKICWREQIGGWAQAWNIGSVVKQHAETAGHDIHPNYANILETGVKTKNKRLLIF